MDNRSSKHFSSEISSQKKDRYIIPLNPMQLELGEYHFSNHQNSSEDAAKENYRNVLSYALFNMGSKTLNTRSIFDKLKNEEYKSIPNSGNSVSIKKTKELDAPRMVNDFYLNLLAWGNQDIIYLALAHEVYSYHVITKTIQTPLTVSNQYDFSAVGVAGANYWYAASTCGEFLVMNNAIDQPVRKVVIPNSAYITNFAASENPHVFFASTNANSTFCFDARAPIVVCHILNQGHDNNTIRVPGLSYNQDNLLATGSDGRVLIWDVRRFNQPVTSNTMLGHSTTVKALQFHPKYKNMIASGAGRSDPVIKVWDVTNNNVISQSNAADAVSSVQWLSDNYLLSTQATFESKDPITLWNVSQSKKVCAPHDDINFHEHRILCAAKDPNNNTFATLISNESLLFWDVNNMEDRKKYKLPEKESKFELKTIR